jgi:Terminase small subunit
MTPRQLRFVEEYARVKNAAEAARRAGYSPFNAAVRGAVLLRTASVAASLREKGVDVPEARAEPRSFCRDRDGLTQRQRRFVEQYLILGNASAASPRALLVWGGRDEGIKMAGVSAHSNDASEMRSPAIRTIISGSSAARASR